MFGPLLGYMHGDLVEKVAGVECGFVGGLDEADDALGVGCDEEGEVGGGELGEGRGWNDQGRGAAELFGCGFGWFGRGGSGDRWLKFCEGWFWRALRCSGDRWGGLREESVDVDLVLADSEERRHDLLSEADALGAPFGKEKENRGGAVVRVDAWSFADGEEGKRERDGGEVGAEESVLAAGFGDGDGVVGLQRGGESGVEFGYGFCSGLRVSSELLQGGEGEAIGIQGVDGDGSVCSG